MSHNVTDIRRFASPNRDLRSKAKGWQNVAGRRRGNVAKRNDLADWKPGADRRAAERISFVMRRFANHILSNCIFYRFIKYYLFIRIKSIIFKIQKNLKQFNMQRWIILTWKFLKVLSGIQEYKKQFCLSYHEECD